MGNHLLSCDHPLRNTFDLKTKVSTLPGSEDVTPLTILWYAHMTVSCPVNIGRLSPWWSPSHCLSAPNWFQQPVKNLKNFLNHNGGTVKIWSHWRFGAMILSMKYLSQSKVETLAWKMKTHGFLQLWDARIPFTRVPFTIIKTCNYCILILM